MQTQTRRERERVGLEVRECPGVVSPAPGQ